MRFLLLTCCILCFGLIHAQAETHFFLPLKADVVVAADGSGDVKTVTEAIAKVPENNQRRFVIHIRSGVYNEQVRIPASKPFITFIGESAQSTRIAFDINNKRAGTTSAAYAVYVGGHDFHAENITFENSFAYKPGESGSQAVAVLSEADRLVFRNCRFLGWQDTLYAKNGRQYFENCYIEGHVDFIFGQAAAVFDKCVIHSKADGYITAPMRFGADERSGFVFIDSKLTAANTDKGVFLGRPWRAYGRSVFINTEMGAHIRPEGWNNWGNSENEKTAYFAEFGSKGPGANADKRVAWMHKLSKDQAGQFDTANFLKGNDGWNPKTADDAWLEKTRPDWRLVSWSEVLRQQPLWYQTDEAARIADQVVLYQKENGGWEKNMDMSLMLTQAEREKLAATKSDTSNTTIDNRATYTQLEYLAKTISGSFRKTTPPTNHQKHLEAFNKGIDYLLEAQYPNGGWPQFYPLHKGYYTHITFNDNAMIGVMNLLRDIAENRDDFRFVDQARRARAADSISRALRVIIRTQLIVGGRKTVWAQQYDENTLEPASARTFEPVALTAAESVGVVRYLMRLEKPDKEIVEAIDSAVKWYRKNAIRGIRWEKKDGVSRVIIDPKAPNMWARFYETKTMKPIFIGRDSVIHYDVYEIEPERRNGYAWYTGEPRELLEKDYPEWRKRIGLK